LLLGWSDPKETGQTHRKAIRILRFGKAHTGGRRAVGVLTEALDETGNRRSYIRQSSNWRQYLLSAYAEFKSSGFLPYHPNQEAVRQLRILEMARKFSEVLSATLANFGKGR